MIIIITHENTDFDALASSVAATKLYPGSIALLPGTLHPNVRSFVNLYRDLLPMKETNTVEGTIDSLVIVDTNSRERIGSGRVFLEKAEQIIVYDHHPGDENFDADITYIEPVGSTTTMLLEKIIESNARLTEFEATLFALGIYEDTGNLTYDIATARDARAIAYLWECGINVRVLREYLRLPLNDIQKNLLEALLRNSELYELNQHRVLICNTELDQYVVGAAVLIQLINEIEDADITIAIIKMSESIYLAARTRSGELNLLELLAPFEVKGYPSAVSANLKGFDESVVKEQIIELFNYYLPPLINAGKVASKPVFTIDSGTSVAEADEMLSEKGIKGCPVTEDGRLVGIVSRRDLQKGLRSELEHAPVKGFMTRQVITALPGANLRELRHIMVDNNIGRIPIIDHKDIIVGIVTRTDILRYLSDLDRNGNSLTTKAGAGLRENRLGRREKDKQADDDKVLSSRIQKILLQISQIANREGINVYLVGGMIRDLMLKHPLEKDLDFVVVGDAIAFTYKVQKLMGGTVRHFEQFGTATVDLPDGLRLDFVTARKEIYTSPAALPRVESSNLKNDLYRRDFTINAMARSLSGENYGKLFDYFNGKGDLQNKVIRALYKLSFVDDPLRILRALRFEQRYNFTIEPDTLDSIKNAIERKVIEKVSRQRLNQELKLIFKEPSPYNILKRFDQLNLIESLYPRVNPDKSAWQLLYSIEEILRWAMQRNWGNKIDSELLYLAGIIYNLEPADQSAIIRKLSLSKERTSIIFSACREIPGILIHLEKSGLSPGLIVSNLERLPVEAILFAFALTEKTTIRNHLKLYMNKLRHIRPATNGLDLKKMGLENGPRYREVIESLKNAVLDGDIHSLQEEQEYIKKYLKTGKKEEK